MSKTDTELTIEAAFQTWANQHNMKGAAGPIAFGIAASDKAAVASILSLIQARDLAHKAALLQAVGKLEATCETCDGKFVMQQQSASSEWQETETWPCEEPIHDVENAINEIYGGSHE